MILVTVGLPGSGKTHYAKNFRDFDYICGDDFDTLDDLITKLQVSYGNIIVDGLFLTEKVQERFLGINARFIYFEPCVETCVYNDKIRNRDLSSESVIRNARVHKPHDKYIHTSETPKKYTYTDTVISDISLDSWKYNSEEWCTGGSYGTCWDEDGPAELSPDPELGLETCTGYIDIIEHFFKGSEITKAILNYSHFVEMIHDSESDYYGGCRGFSYWQLKYPKGLIKAILKDKYGVDNTSYPRIIETHPELFL